MAKACAVTKPATTGSKVPAVEILETAKNWSVGLQCVEMAPAKMAPLVRVVGATQIATVVSVGRAPVGAKSDQMADGNLGETESVKRGHRAPHVDRAATVFLSGLNPLACADTESANLEVWVRAAEATVTVMVVSVWASPLKSMRLGRSLMAPADAKSGTTENLKPGLMTNVSREIMEICVESMMTVHNLKMDMQNVEKNWLVFLHIAITLVRKSVAHLRIVAGQIVRRVVATLKMKSLFLVLVLGWMTVKTPNLQHKAMLEDVQKCKQALRSNAGGKKERPGPQKFSAVTKHCCAVKFPNTDLQMGVKTVF